MKNLILASAMALSSIFVTAAPSDAASVTVTERSGPRVTTTTTVRESYRPHRPRHHCTVKKVRIRDNGRVIVRTKRVCR